MQAYRTTFLLAVHSDGLLQLQLIITNLGLVAELAEERRKTKKKKRKEKRRQEKKKKKEKTMSRMLEFE